MHLAFTRRSRPRTTMKQNLLQEFAIVLSKRFAFNLAKQFSTRVAEQDGVYPCFRLASAKPGTSQASSLLPKCLRSRVRGWSAKCLPTSRYIMPVAKRP